MYYPPPFLSHFPYSSMNVFKKKMEFRAIIAVNIPPKVLMPD